MRHRLLQPGELDIGFVQHDDQRQIEQPPQVVGREQTAVGVVGRGEEEEFGVSVVRGACCVISYSYSVYSLLRRFAICNSLIRNS